MRRALLGSLLALAAAASGCGPERPPMPGTYTSPGAAPTPAGRKDLPESAYRIEWGELRLPAKLAPGERADVPLALTNAGSDTWPASGLPELYVVRLSHRWLRASGEVLADYGALRVDLPGPLPPRQSQRLVATLVAPSAPGDYLVEFDLVHEGVGWFSARGAGRKLVPVRVE